MAEAEETNAHELPSVAPLVEEKPLGNTESEVITAPPSYRSLAQPQLQPQAYQTDAITPAESEVTTTPPSYRSLVQPQVYRTDVVRPGSYATLSAVVVAICGGLALCSLPCSISAMVLSAMVS